MGFSFSEDTGDGAKKTFAFSFIGPDNGYFDKGDIMVYIDEVLTSHTLTGPNQITLAIAPVAGAKVRIVRKPNLDEPYTDFTRGNAFGKTNVNRSFIQQLYVSHRSMDGFKEEGYYEKQDLSMGTKYKIRDLAPGVLYNDAATVGQLGNSEEFTSIYAGEAADSAAAAALSASTAIAAKNSATLSASASALSASQAAQSAIESANNAVDLTDLYNRAWIIS